MGETLKYVEQEVLRVQSWDPVLCMTLSHHLTVGIQYIMNLHPWLKYYLGKLFVCLVKNALCGVIKHCNRFYNGAALEHNGKESSLSAPIKAGVCISEQKRHSVSELCLKVCIL